jgi:hypothetical protein
MVLFLYEMENIYEFWKIFPKCFELENGVLSSALSCQLKTFLRGRI